MVFAAVSGLALAHHAIRRLGCAAAKMRIERKKPLLDDGFVQLSRTEDRANDKVNASPWDVAQICNLLYRRFEIGKASNACGARQVANLRYSRLKICATTLSLALGPKKCRLNRCWFASNVPQYFYARSRPALFFCRMAIGLWKEGQPPGPYRGGFCWPLRRSSSAPVHPWPRSRRFSGAMCPGSLNGFPPFGRLDAVSRLDLAIGLPLRNREATHKPASRTFIIRPCPNFRHYLTPDQFAAGLAPARKNTSR